MCISKDEITCFHLTEKLNAEEGLVQMKWWTRWKKKKQWKGERSAGREKE